MAAAAMAAGGGGAEGDAIGQRFLVQEERLAVVVDHFAASRAPGARGAEDGDWRLALAEMREDARHALQVVRVHVEQSHSYDETRRRIHSESAHERQEIVSINRQLEDERRERQHKEAVQALRRAVQQVQSRQQSEAALASLRSEIAQLSARNDELARELDMRSKQLALLLHSANQLKRNWSQTSAPKG